MYREFTPCALLAPFIDKFWVFKGYAEIGTRFKILADGCTDFIFSIGNMTIPADEHQMIMQPYRSFFVGPMRSYSNLTATTDSLHMLGVRFQPCGLAAFTNGLWDSLPIFASSLQILTFYSIIPLPRCFANNRTIPSVSALSKAILYAFSPNPFK
jgi:hypothetical protein